MNIFLIVLFFLGCFLFTQIELKYSVPYIKWFFIVPFCFIVANRSLKVPDTEAYYDYFYAADNGSFDDFGNSSFEIGFQVFSKLVKFIIGENFVLYLGVVTLINLLIIDFASKRISNLFRIEQQKNNVNDFFVGDNRFFINSYFSILPLTLYVAFFGIYLNAIVLRVGIALSLLILASFFAIKEKKSIFDYFLIFLLLVLSCFFHSTALIGFLIILILFSKIRLKKKKYLWIWLFIGLIYFTNFSTWLGNTVFSFMASLNELTLVASKLSSYDGDVIHEIDGVSMKFVFFWIMAFVLIFEGRSGEIYNKYLNVYLLGLVIFGLFRSVLLIERVTDFFLLFSFVIFYLFLLMQNKYMFWLFYIFIVVIQLTFVLRITNQF
jgi:hypothetical protein